MLQETFHLFEGEFQADGWTLFFSQNGKAMTAVRECLAVTRSQSTKAAVTVTINDLAVVNLYLPDS